MAVNRGRRAARVRSGWSADGAVDGRAYGLRNVATPEETEKGLRRIWVNDPDGVGGKKDMTILLENALDLCE